MKRLNLIISLIFCLLIIQIISAQNVENKIPEMLVGGLGCVKATNLVKPPYPQKAKAANVSGQVEVSVIVGKDGKVESAQAVSGHPLLREAAEKAALASKYSPTTIKGVPVKVKGIIVYNFVNENTQESPVTGAQQEAKAGLSPSKTTTKPIRPSRKKKRT